MYQITISNSIFDIQNGHHKPGPGCIPALVEDPVRRTYKRLLALTFLASSSLHILLEVVFQVIAAGTARRHTQGGDCVTFHPILRLSLPTKHLV